MPLGQFDEKTPFLDSERFESTDTPGTYKQVFDVQAPAMLRIDMIQVFNSDTVSHTVVISGNNSDQLTYAAATVPAGAGYGTTPPVDLLGLALPGTQFHYLIFWDNALWFTVGEAVTAATAVHFVLQGGYV